MAQRKFKIKMCVLTLATEKSIMASLKRMDLKNVNDKYLRALVEAQQALVKLNAFH